ncbi:class I SAM-dependent methyltransferase [Azomonas macrocytogenes]|uniref:2-polyprenyl-3-methyl-5-hydroxy-6-metoxy-1, 4-benzoquinol methylase n=1 Tax=Azomonas macrocytogenes TaxID=69962 RepID=A0A839T3R4_AZOMA|nr:methyltransferase domain-containing protein [Azomonas macrocytogenes]MBB3103126.1 2-polyprenyl-3-methyl-5-hydroxy-6-metoxy-1,4-benzoquinol methylase [Azomonas macrocytogenes]
MSSPEEHTIIETWHENAEAWAEAIATDRIASRVEVTNAAILAAIRERAPTTLLDMGCGEGWLGRALAADRIEIHGIDGVPTLLEKARASSPGTYEEMTYAALAAGAPLACVEMVVCNFSLLGNESTCGVIGRVPQLLQPNGTLLIQTLHPLAVGMPGQDYREGWRQGSWAGCPGAFGRAAPWYFRPLGAWIKLLVTAGLRLEALYEPLDSASGRPCSVIFAAGLGQPEHSRSTCDKS